MNIKHDLHYLHQIMLTDTLQMEKVTALVVTYNRLQLLKQAISAIRLQTYAVSTIMVVNNGSTDDTGVWLSSQPDIQTIYLKDNLGASGGFSAGLKIAANSGREWLWVMDDDTICRKDTLEKLIVNIPELKESTGFIGSKCVWQDGEPHLMNVPSIKPLFNNKTAFNHYDQFGLVLADSNSWVSILLNTQAVKQVGLPYKEFFFWSDDLEYTQRITKAGYLGFYCPDSVVLHATITNYNPDFYRDALQNIWKYKHGFRNEFFLKRKEKGYLYFSFWLMAKLGYTSYKVYKLRKDHRLKFMSVLYYSAWKSLFFNPKIDQVPLPFQPSNVRETEGIYA